MNKVYQIETRPEAHPENIIQGASYRITILTAGLVRLEYSLDGVFEDRPTQTVLNRDFKPAAYQVVETEEELQVITERIHLIYNKKEFTSYGLSIQVLGNISNYHSTWHYGEEPEDLFGTARTLDRVNGSCELEHGLMSRFGFSVTDDSDSLILTEDGWVEPREKGKKDLYFWGYGHDYRECLKDFYHLCGRAPMIPRFALGNWWSRYFDYSEESYKELMGDFEKENIPFSVAVIDMDWHLVDIDPAYGSGWTGYTWNRELFPEPERFIKWLHEKGMRVTLNVHPADGVRAYEEMYTEMAEAMGMDPDKKVKVDFDISSPRFLEAYFDILHHPNEEKGVDFWWIDWQQGKNCRIEGLDPLWMLNHYHYLDNGRNGKRPMTFSRYAGPGSHRYPIGFSGDAHITWETLDFEVYFTLTASNIGYGWWSHDIGGHMEGYKDDELMARWTQFGVFSPIMRLHSTKDLFYSKEPWFFGLEVRRAMGEALRLRHRLLPYLYTMNYRAYKEGLPLVEPMYYAYPEEERAYEVKNQYRFGSGLIVAPITRKNVPHLHMGSVKVWLPEKKSYIDLITGMVYQGGRTVIMHRDIRSIPVLAETGAIIPMTDCIFGKDAVTNPKSLRIKVFAGDNGAFELYEDDNETQDYRKGICAVTKFEWNWDERCFIIHPVKGEGKLLPESREYIVEICGCTESGVSVSKNGAAVSCESSYDKEHGILRVTVSGIAPQDRLIFRFDADMELRANDKKKLVFDFLNRAELPYLLKSGIYKTVCGHEDTGMLLSDLQAMDLDRDLFECLCEILV